MIPVRNILFDFGGVFLDIDFSLTFQAFQKLTPKPFADVFPLGFGDPLLLELETGQISPGQFRDGLRERLAINCSDEALDYAWNALLLSIPDSRVELIKKVAHNYRIFLLSNTNIIHYQEYNGTFKKHWGHDFDQLFEKAFWSHELKLRKPDLACYQQVIKMAGIEASETVFIDDSRQNIDGALQAGLRAVHLRSEVAELFDEKGFLSTTLIEFRS